MRTDRTTQRQRLYKRGLSERQIQQRFNAQLSHASKKSGVEDDIARHRFGKLWHYATPDTATDSEGLLRKIMAETNPGLRCE